MLAELLPIPLFPEGALSASVITTVWIGVFVVVFFNLRFGWVLSGLVVPGYLVPLLLLKPWSVVAILAEGITTYLIVWLFSERFSQYGYWSALFGRDRFFALVLISIIVRISFDGWVLPGVGHWLTQEWGLVFDYRNDLHSLGLIIVALVANQFWKTGLLRGMTQLLIILLVTWVLVRFGLMKLTNFGIGGLSYMYEDLAASVLASPKAYIILVMTAFVASRMNLHYGWEFNGILIPALLALQWYEPAKILFSFLEAFIILFLAIQVLKLPMFASSTIEGGRKLLLFFNIGFAYKISLGFVLFYYAPQVKITDYYAFGYLLSTLIAIKMHDKEIAMRLTRATLQTSLVSVFLASFLGWCLTLIPETRLWHQVVEKPQQQSLVVSGEKLNDKIQMQLPALYGQRNTVAKAPTAIQIDTFVQALTLLKNDSSEQWAKAAQLLGQINYQLELLQDRYLLLTDKDSERGWGIYLIDSQAPGQLSIQLPKPLETRGMINSAVTLFSGLNAKALSIASVKPLVNESQSLFHGFHRQSRREDVLQLRGVTPLMVRRLSGIKGVGRDVGQVGNQLWIKKRLPAGVDLAHLKKMIGKYQLHWVSPPFDSLERRVSSQGFAELVLDQAGHKQLLLSHLQLKNPVAVEAGMQRIEGYLYSWLTEGKTLLAGKGSDSYRKPELEELLYFDEEVLQPVLSAVEEDYRGNSNWTEGGRSRLAAAANAASIMGYQLVAYRHQLSGKEYLILYESNQKQMRYWGIYVFRLGAAEAMSIQAPRPLFESNSFEFSLYLFERMKARALLIAGAHPLANKDLTADVVRSANRQSLFSLVNQALMRHAAGKPFLGLQCRAFSQRPQQALPQEDILISLGQGLNISGAEKNSLQLLQKQLHQDGWSSRVLKGEKDTAGYEVGNLTQARYLNASENTEFALLWLSPKIRRGFRQLQENSSLFSQLTLLGVKVTGRETLPLLQKFQASATTIDKEHQQMLRDYLLRQDIVQLAQLQKNYRLQAEMDKDSNQLFVILTNTLGKLVAVMNLNSPKPEQQVWVKPEQLQSKIKSFMQTRDGLLLVSPEHK